MPERAPDYESGQAIPGTVYRVHRVLGAGGMGTVYDVEDTTVGKRYVLKTLHGALADRSDLAARLAREARALAKLQHPNIVEVYTSGTTRDALRLPYYVMERLQGQSLRTVLERKGRLTVEQACDIGIDLLDALDHAHEFGIIHRDVKPDNLFITRGRDGRSLAKLLDFGIIKLATTPGAAASLATGGRFIGTFRYAPPEQILGREVTPRSDLYAAGLVLYEMMAGRGPFDDFTGEMEIGKAHISVPAPPLSRFVEVPAAIEQVVMSALDKDQALRPRDAFAFASTLRGIKKQLGTNAPSSRALTQAATVEQIVPQPSSVARPASLFGAQATEAGVPSAAETARVDQLAATVATAPPRSQTVSLGVAPLGPPPQETVAAGPLAMTSGAAPLAAPMPYAIDRHAETRAAAPEAPLRPNYDTAPIPLAVLAPPTGHAPPGPSNETFGPHTTDASSRKKASARGAVIAALVASAAFVCVAIVGLAAWKRIHARATAAPAPAAETMTATAAPPPSPATVREPAPSEAISVAPPVEAAPRHAVPASTGKRVRATPVAAAPSAVVETTPTPAHVATVERPSPPRTHPANRLPGSGL